MKRYSVLIFIYILTMGHIANTQNMTDYTTFEKKVLNRYGIYFEKMAAENDNITYLYAKELYSDLAVEEKTKIIEYVFGGIEGELILVSYNYNRELWSQSGYSVKIIENMNLNEITLQTPGRIRVVQKTDVHPCFFYLGGQMSWSGDYFNMHFSTRVGSYLLKNKWDMALSASININDYASMVDIGPTSRVYFPIKKYKISPYTGAGISYSYKIEDSVGDWNAFLLFGISWFIGPGSLDLGFQVGDSFTTTIGYTFMPKKKK